MSKVLYCTLILLFSSIQFCYGSDADIEDELQSYIEIFNGDNYSRQRSAIEPLAWAGISDSRLYDLIEAKLLSSYLLKGKVAAEKASWFAKALALSGNEKYLASLNNAAKNAKSGKTRKHSKTALKRLSKYAQWNPVISSGLSQAPTGELEKARVKNMLRATEPELLKIGAKRVYYAHAEDTELVGIARERLLRDYATVKGDEQIDASAWLIKAISKSGDAENKQALSNIVETASNKKLIKYAKKYLNYL